MAPKLGKTSLIAKWLFCPNFSFQADVYCHLLKMKFSTDISTKFSDRLSSSMLPWESNFGAKFLIMAFDRKTFWVVHHTVNLWVF